MIQNLQEKLHQGKHKLDENLSVKNAPKRSAKYLEDKIFKNDIIQSISVTLKTFLTLICTKYW